MTVRHSAKPWRNQPMMDTFLEVYQSDNKERTLNELDMGMNSYYNIKNLVEAKRFDIIGMIDDGEITLNQGISMLNGDFDSIPIKKNKRKSNKRTQELNRFPLPHQAVVKDLSYHGLQFTYWSIWDWEMFLSKIGHREYGKRMVDNVLQANLALMDKELENNALAVSGLVSLLDGKRGACKALGLEFDLKLTEQEIKKLKKSKGQ